MAIDFPVLSRVWKIIHFKVGVFCLKYGKIDVFGQISAFFCLVSIERGRGQEKYFHR